jgi:hypothetical protein
MTGPYPPEYGAGPVGPQMYAPQPYPESVPSPYPSMLPPPLQYPNRRWWPIVAVVVAVAVVAAVVAAVVLASRNDNASGHVALTEASAKAAIQEYLDAMTKGDDQTVARHTLCGLYDAVKEHRSDLALASLSSDAFRKQYSRAEVTTIDKMVLWSPNQAQVLFTMQVTPARGSTRGQAPKNTDEQAIAQLLAQDNEILVCSYLPRTAGQY